MGRRKVVALRRVSIAFPDFVNRTSLQAAGRPAPHINHQTVPVCHLIDSTGINLLLPHFIEVVELTLEQGIALCKKKKISPKFPPSS